MSDERNNLDRIEQGEEKEAVKKEKPTPKTGDPLSFIEPTISTPLPSQGNFYPDDHFLSGKDTLEFNSMTAKEEEILNNQSLIKKGVAVDRVINNLLADQPIGSDDLLSGDKNSLLIEARIDAYTPRYEVDIQCPSCTSHQEEVYDLEEESEMRHGGLESLSERLRERLSVEKYDDTRFFLTLPKTGVDAVIRPLYGEDQAKINKGRRRKENKNLSFNRNIQTMRRFVESLNGDENVSIIKEFCEEMPAADSRDLKRAFNQLYPNRELRIEFNCNSCNLFDEREVPIRASFFWPDQ